SAMPASVRAVASARSSRAGRFPPAASATKPLGTTTATSILPRRTRSSASGSVAGSAASSGWAESAAASRLEPALPSKATPAPRPALAARKDHAEEQPHPRGQGEGDEERPPVGAEELEVLADQGTKLARHQASLRLRPVSERKMPSRSARSVPKWWKRWLRPARKARTSGARARSARVTRSGGSVAPA